MVLLVTNISLVWATDWVICIHVVNCLVWAVLEVGPLVVEITLPL